MPGSSPGEAVAAFLDPVKSALRVLDCEGVLVYRDHPPLDAVQTATLERGEGMRVAATGPYSHLRLLVVLEFKVIRCEEDEVRGPYRCTSVGYIFELQDASNTEIVSYHWHPTHRASPVTKPHAHVGDKYVEQMARLHIPTPRVTVEEFVEVCIDQFGAATRMEEDAWRERLGESLDRHRQYREWGTHAEAPEFLDEV